MKKNLIIVGLIQFGYNTDTYKACEFLNNEYAITYIGFDYGNPKIKMQNVNVVYVRHNNRLLRKLRLIASTFKHAHQQKSAIIFTAYFRLCSILSLLQFSHKCVIDYRTGSVSPNKFKNWFKNMNMFIESVFFRHIVTLTEDLKKHLRLPSRTRILPLGADPISITNKTFEELKLLYVGILTGRHIHETILGIAQFKEAHPEASIKYYIAGRGDNTLIKKEIEIYNLQENVKLLGFVPREEIVQYYDKCNLGICYAPVKRYYINQPFTKLYEYCMSGMPVISVRVHDSVRRVSNDNGELCDDNPGSFSDALEKIYKNRAYFDSTRIRGTVAEFSWENISTNIFKKIIDE